MDAARHLRRPTTRRVDANNALTWAFAWCPHQSSNLGPQGLPLACPGAALMCLFCLVQQQFWRLPGSAEDRPITVESWSLPMNKR